VKLATINRGPNRELRIRWREFKGHQFLDIREWSVNVANSQWFPTKGKGVALNARELNDFAAAVTRALALLERQGE
jgi:transcriptional coactivator p15 (PC4)